MIDHWKVLDLEIAEFRYHHDPTPSGEITPFQTSCYNLCDNYFIMRDEVEHPTSGVRQKRRSSTS